MAWYSLTVDVLEDLSELAQSVLYDHGAAGLEVRDSLNPTVLTVRAPVKGEAILIAYFEDKTDAKDAQEELTEKIAGARFAIDDVVERDWSVEWPNQIKSVTVGRLWVGPPWEKPTAPKDKVCIFIEPK